MELQDRRGGGLPLAATAGTRNAPAVSATPSAGRPRNAPGRTISCGAKQPGRTTPGSFPGHNPSVNGRLRFRFANASAATPVSLSRMVVPKGGGTPPRVWTKAARHKTPGSFPGQTSSQALAPASVCEPVSFFCRIRTGDTARPLADSGSPENPGCRPRPADGRERQKRLLTGQKRLLTGQKRRTAGRIGGTACPLAENFGKTADGKTRSAQTYRQRPCLNSPAENRRF